MRIDYGEPFVGKAGKLMNMAFQTLGIKREEVYIKNLVKLGKVISIEAAKNPKLEEKIKKMSSY